ncbi:MAG: ATP-binding protein [Burkholderiales bacterium]
MAALTDAELKTMFAETGPDFSAELCLGAGMSDLSPHAIRAFRERWATRTRDERKVRWTDDQTLVNAELLVDARITYAALILFGTRTALGRWLAQAELVFEYRSSEASGPAADREEFREGFFLWHDAIWNKINLRNDRQSYQDGLFRIELPTFDEVSVREVLLNAVAHRDYRLGGSVFVRQYSQRLEAVSPGGLPPGITPDNILDQQNPRNRRLAEALAKCGLIERSGQGMNLIFESAIRQGKALPSFAGTSAHEVRLTLYGAVASPAFVRFIERLGEEKLRSFSTYDLSDSGVAAGAAQGTGYSQRRPNQKGALVSWSRFSELQLERAILMILAIAISKCSHSLLIRKQFGAASIATGALLVAIPEQIHCKRGQVSSVGLSRSLDASA